MSLRVSTFRPVSAACLGYRLWPRALPGRPPCRVDGLKLQRLCAGHAAVDMGTVSVYFLAIEAVYLPCVETRVAARHRALVVPCSEGAHDGSHQQIVTAAVSRPGSRLGGRGGSAAVRSCRRSGRRGPAGSERPDRNRRDRRGAARQRRGAGRRGDQDRPHCGGGRRESAAGPEFRCRLPGRGLSRLPQAPGPQRRRRDHHGHARPLARLGLDPRLPGPQGRLCREADEPDDPRGPAHDAGGPQVPPRLPDRQPAAFPGRQPAGLRTGAQRPHRQSAPRHLGQLRQPLGVRPAGPASARGPGLGRLVRSPRRSPPTTPICTRRGPSRAGFRSAPIPAAK